MMDIQNIEREMAFHTAFQISLADRAIETLLPELCEVLGHDKALDFLDLFGGLTVRFPEKDVVLDAVADASIFIRINEGEEARDLAVEHDLSREEVEQRFREMSSLVAAVGAGPLLTLSQKQRREDLEAP